MAGYGTTDYKAHRAAIMKERQRREQLEEQWRPNPGRYVGRILPPIEGFNSWSVQYGVHYRILPNAQEGEGNGLICLKRSFNEPCAACDLVRSMWDSGNPAEQEKARSIGSKDRWVVNFVKLSDSVKKVVRWSFGIKVWNQLSEIAYPPLVEVEDGVTAPEATINPIDDPDKGYNLNILVKQVRDPKSNNVYNEMTVTVPPGTGPVPLRDKSILTKLHDLRDWVRKQAKTFEEQRALLGLEGAPPVENEPGDPSDAPVEEFPEDAPPEVVEADVVDAPEPPPAKPAAKVTAPAPAKTAPAPQTKPGGPSATQNAAAKAKQVLNARFGKP